MVQQKRSRRLNPVDQAISSSANVPAPSTTRISLAGTTERGVAAVGDVLNKIGQQQLAIQQDIEIKNGVLDAQSEINTIIATNTRDIKDAEEFQLTTQNQIGAKLKGLLKKRGGTVGRNLDLQFKDLTNKANIAIAKQGIIKTQDAADDLFIRVRDDAINTALIGVRGGDPDAIGDGLAKIQAQTDFQVQQGTMTQTQRTEALNDAKKDLALGKFNIEVNQNPALAFKNLEFNKDLSEELKISVFDKASRKVTFANKLKEQKQTVDRNARATDLFSRVRRGEATEDDLIKDRVDNPDNPLSESTSRILLNKIYEVEKVGGVGNVSAFNDMMRKVRKSPDLFSIDDLYAFEEDNGLNTEQSERLEEKWTSLTTGTSDPNDITTFRAFKEGVKFTNLFQPSRFDVGAQLGVKKLRFDQARSFAEGRAVELFKTNKNVDSVMAQVEFETLKHMKDYDTLVQEFIDEGTLDQDETSIFEIKEKVEPVLKEREALEKASKELEGKIAPSVTIPPEGSTDTDKEARLDAIEAIFDKADEEGRELTEDEIAKIDELQESE